VWYHWHQSLVRVTRPTRLIYICHMAHSYVWYDWRASSVYVTCLTWLIDMCEMCDTTDRQSLVRVTRLIHMCDMTDVHHPFVPFHSLDPLICVTCVIPLTSIVGTCHATDWTPLYLRRGSFICVIWLTCIIRICDVPHVTHWYVLWYVWYNWQSIAGSCHATDSTYLYLRRDSFIRAIWNWARPDAACHRCDSFMCVMGWTWLIHMRDATDVTHSYV